MAFWFAESIGPIFWASLKTVKGFLRDPHFNGIHHENHLRRGCAPASFDMPAAPLAPPSARHRNQIAILAADRRVERRGPGVQNGRLSDTGKR